MALLTLHSIQLGFGGPALLDQLDLTIEERERICLIGRNGAGKSTLLKVIEGELAIDSGERRLQTGINVSKLAQDVPDDIDLTVYDVVASGLEEVGELLTEYHHLSHSTVHDEEWMNRLAIVQQKLEQNNGWDLSQQVETVLSRLSLPSDTQFSDLSGGLKRRVLLAKALLQQPDILLLDEPTNHLDIEAIEWLESFLKSFKGSIVFITHDRAFLRNMATRIIELDRGRLISFPGNYDQFLIRKEEMLQSEEAENARFDKKLAKEEVWIRQGIKARRTRNEGRVRSLEKMRDERSQRRLRQGNANITLETSQKTGKQVVKAKNISFSYPDKTIVSHFSTKIRRGDKVAILGPNGVGKTTLLKILLGKIEAQEGTIELGTNIELAYFDQLREQLDPEQSVRENLASGSDQITVNGKSKHVISYLQDFLFTPDRIHSPVSTLSGGEKNRLLLARLFTKPANVLVMDEPTNDLDIETLELLEELLLEYTGTLLLISHDRNFVDHIATNTIAFEGDGKLTNYIGGYEDWQRQRQNKLTNQKSQHKTKVKPVTAPKPIEKNKKNLTYKEKLELESLPVTIEKLEAEIEALQAVMSRADFYQQSQTKINKTQDDLAKIETELAKAYKAWEILEEKQ
ncbi:MAG: ATP-binding cassette domain-containing protein [Thiotrichaceae bacterium]|nr:ATP-binding cassette domain-containing protein [Thiotrichaceae bacterium]